MAAAPTSDPIARRATRKHEDVRRPSRRGVLRVLGAAGATLALWTPRPSAADPVAGELYYTRFSGAPNLKKVNFRFDGETLRFESRSALATLEGADGLIFAPDGDLIVGGQGDRVHKVKVDGSGAHVTHDVGGHESFHLALDPRGQSAWTSGMPGALVEVPLAPFAPGVVRVLNGDDTTITAIAFDDRGAAYYTAGDFRGFGSFGAIDLETFTTRRLMEGIAAAHAITFDSFSGDLFLFGGDEIVQIAPSAPQAIKSSRRFDLTGQFDQGTGDGQGHLFVAHNTGRVAFIDYADSRLIGDETSVTAIAFLDSNLDDVAPMSGPGAKPAAAPEPEPSAEAPPAAEAVPERPTEATPEAGSGEDPANGLSAAVAVAAAAAAALIAVMAWMGFVVFGRKRAPEGGQPDAGSPPDAAAWREDWSETRTLVDRLAEGGTDDLNAHLRANPDVAREAAATVKVIDGAEAAIQRAATAYQEDTDLARFSHILARFASGAPSVTTEIAAAEGEAPIRVVHSMSEEMRQSWAEVEVAATGEGDGAYLGDDAEVLRAVEHALSGLIVDADPQALAERLLVDLAAATGSTAGFMAEVRTTAEGKAEFQTLASLGDGSQAGVDAALSAEVARRIDSEGDSGVAISGETDAGPFVTIPLRAEGAVIGALTLGGRESGYDTRTLGILGMVAAVMAAALGGKREDRGKAIETALRRISDATGEGTAPSSAAVDGLRRGLARLAAAAGGEVRTENVDLSDMAQKIAAELAAGAPDRAARFDIAEGVGARCDPRLLGLALEDLLGRAWAATADNERTEIAFGARDEGEDRVYFFSDNGPGFEADTADEDGVSLGRLYDAGALAGAGLATVQRVVDRHGGRIRAHGRAGEGASFDFTLPAERGDGAQAKPAPWRMIPTKPR